MGRYNEIWTRIKEYEETGKEERRKSREKKLKELEANIRGENADVEIDDADLDGVLLEDTEEKDDEAIVDAVNDALDNGMIYTEDQWTAYRMYCEMGDNPDIMWEGLFNDVYSIVNHMVEDTEEETEEIKESCKKPVKESVLSEKGNQALKNRR